MSESNPPLPQVAPASVDTGEDEEALVSPKTPTVSDAVQSPDSVTIDAMADISAEKNISPASPTPVTPSNAAVQPSHLDFIPDFDGLSLHAQKVLKHFGMKRMPTTEKQLRALINKINATARSDVPSAPKAPVLPALNHAELDTNIFRIQKYIEGFEYNHTDRPSYYDVRKTQGMYRIARTAKEIIANPLPIKCIEAVFMGVYLTNDMKSAFRMPIAFRSNVEGHFFEHIVLGIRSSTGKWGAIGLSRKDTLMYKPLTFKSLGDLLNDYKKSYEECYHTLHYVYLGLPFGRDMYSQDEIQWRVLKMNAKLWDKLEGNVNKYAKDSQSIFETYAGCGKLPKNFIDKYGGQPKKVAQSKTDGDGKALSPKRSSPSRNRSVGTSSPKKTGSPSKSKSRKKKKKTKIKKRAKKLAAAVWAGGSTADPEDNDGGAETPVRAESAPSSPKKESKVEK